MTEAQVQRKSKINKGGLIIWLFVIIYGCSISCLALYLLNYTYRNPAKHLTIKLLSSECSHAINTTVEQVKWTGPKELTCIVSFDHICEITGWQGDYRINENNLMLYYFSSGWSASGCLCHYQLKYTIRGLEKRDYQITADYVDK